MKSRMHNYLTLTIVLVFFLAAPAWARFKNSSQLISKLKTYDTAYFDNAVIPFTAEQLAEQKVEVSAVENEPKVDLVKQIQPKKLNRVMDDLESAVDYASKQKNLDAAVVKEILQLAALTTHYDATLYAAEVIYPLYKKQTAMVEESLKELSADDAKTLHEGLKNYEREQKSGNG